jgi:amino acid permease
MAWRLESIDTLGLSALVGHHGGFGEGHWSHESEDCRDVEWWSRTETRGRIWAITRASVLQGRLDRGQWSFFEFTGFAVVSNAAEDMNEPARDFPRAMYTTILIVIALYVGLAVATTAAVSKETLTPSGAKLLAEAVLCQ